MRFYAPKGFSTSRRWWHHPVHQVSADETGQNALGLGPLLHLVQQGDDDTSAGSAHGVAQSDGAAVDVDLAHVEVQLAGHEDSCEIMYFLSGTGVCLDDGAEVPVGPGLCHYCPRGHSHSVVNTGTEPLVILGIVPNAK